MILQTPPGAALPTFEHLGVKPVAAQDVNAEHIATTWISAFASVVEARDVQGILSLLYDKPWWRDLFALTWDLRTLFGKDKIAQMLKDRLSVADFSKITLSGAHFAQPWSDVAWISALFDFETKVATGRGVVHLVPTPAGWKALIIATNLDALKEFPEKIGSLRDTGMLRGKWIEQREREQEFVDADPEVLVIGGGQCGLDVAARLKVLGTPTLIVDKNPRIGDQWRNRYESLCLHDPVCELNSEIMLHL